MIGFVVWILVISVFAQARQDASASHAAALPHFDRVVLLETTSEDSANVSIGDLNGDGHPDLVLAKGRHKPLFNRVLLNDGRGGFPEARNLGDAPDRSYSALVVDIDGDGDLDIVVSNDLRDPKLVHLNDGKANFRLGSTYGRPEWSMRNGRVADLNGDGRPDIIAANRTGGGAGANYVCLNKGGGRFDAECSEFSQESATTIAAADFNGDTFVDLAVPNRDGGQSHVYLNDGKAGFSKRVPFGPPDAAIRVAEAADFDRDGLMDIVAIDERRRAAYIFFGRPGGGFAEGLKFGGGDAVPYALAVGDANLDGRTDIVIGHVEARPVVYLNDGTGRKLTAVVFGDDQGAAYGFAIGDLDKDGVPDIAMARSGAPNVVYFGRRP